MSFRNLFAPPIKTNYNPYKAAKRLQILAYNSSLERLVSDKLESELSEVPTQKMKDTVKSAQKEAFLIGLIEGGYIGSALTGIKTRREAVENMMAMKVNYEDAAKDLNKDIEEYREAMQIAQDRMRDSSRVKYINRKTGEKSYADTQRAAIFDIYSKLNKGASPSKDTIQYIESRIFSGKGKPYKDTIYKTAQYSTWNFTDTSTGEKVPYTVIKRWDVNDRDAQKQHSVIKANQRTAKRYKP